MDETPRLYVSIEGGRLQAMVRATDQATFDQNGQPVVPNHNEEAVAYQGIELIDSATVTTPSNILL